MGAIQFGVKENKEALNMQINLYKINFFPGEILKGEINLSENPINPKCPKIINNLTITYSLIHREYWQNHDIISETFNKINDPIQSSDEGKVADDSKHLKEEVIFSKKEVPN